MPNQDALQQRLEDFRAAGRNLQLEPLVTQKALAQFGVPYQTVHDLLVQEGVLSDTTTG